MGVPVVGLFLMPVIRLLSQLVSLSHKVSGPTDRLYLLQGNC